MRKIFAQNKEIENKISKGKSGSILSDVVLNKEKGRKKNIYLESFNKNNVACIYESLCKRFF